MTVKCTNCNREQEYNDENKFCMMCGEKLPTPTKKCISCNKELPLEANFCSSCGTKQEISTESEQFSNLGFHMGNDNNIAGDFNVVGKKEEFNIDGNATIIKNADETKQVKACHICGENKTILEGHNCKNCGKFTCKNCFNQEYLVCNKCAKEKIQVNEDKFKKRLEFFLKDGIIDNRGREELNDLQKELKISNTRALSLENIVKKTLSIDSVMTTIEKINLEKATELFYEHGNILEAYNLLQPLYKKYPQEEKILNVYLPILLRKDLSKLNEVIDNIGFNCFSVYLSKTEIALRENELDVAERNLNKAKEYGNNNILKYYEVLLNILIAKESGDSRYLQKSHVIIDSMVECQDKLEMTYKFKAMRVLSKAECKVLDFITPEYCKEQNLYTDLLVEPTEVYVGTGCDYELIQEAINHVPNGSTIYVQPGIYKENLIIEKKVKIIGINDKILEKASSEVPIVVLDGNYTCDISLDLEIEGIIFTNNENITFNKLSEYISIKKEFKNDNESDDSSDICPTLRIQSNSVLNNVAILDCSGIEINNCSSQIINTIVNNCFRGIHIVKSNSHIKYCKIYNISRSGIWVDEESTGIYENCEIFNTNSSGIYVGEKSNPQVKSCKIHDIHSNGICIDEESTGTYENCEISHTEYTGIYVDEKSNPQVEGCTIHDIPDANGICIYGESTGTYANCKIFNINGSGIEVGGNSNPRVKECKIQDITDGSGIFINESSIGLYEDCEIFNTEYSGICVAEKSNPQVKYCEIHDISDNVGIFVGEESTGLYEKCEIFNTKKAGIGVIGKSNSQVIGCKIYGILDGNGIFIGESSMGLYENCEIYNTKYAGFRVFGNSNPQVKACKIHDVLEDFGLLIDEESTGLYENCEIFNTKDEGIRVDEKSNPQVKCCEIHDIPNNTGIVVKESTGLYENCEIYKTVFAGIAVLETSNAHVIRCKIHHISYGNGIDIRENCTGIYENCEIFNIKHEGIWVGSNSNPQVSGCKIHDIPERSGIMLDDNAMGTYKDCYFYNVKDTINKVVGAKIINCGLEY